MTKFPTDRRVMDERIRELTRSIARNAAQAAGRATMEEYGEGAYVAPQDYMATMYAEAADMVERDKCQTCNGHGMIGALVPWGDGEVDSVAYPCPDCSPLFERRIVRKICTSHIYPPIPCRDYDWTAWFDDVGQEGPAGWGRTEAEARQDLLDNCDE